MTPMKNCVFCQIVKGEKPAYIVYQDDRVIGFLDHRPIQIGHTLVIPRDHYETILDIPDEDLAYLIQITKKITGHIKQRLQAKGLRVSNNNYPAARQIVPHIHFHIIPITGDVPFKINVGRIEVTDSDLEKMAEKIRLK